MIGHKAEWISELSPFLFWEVVSVSNLNAPFTALSVVILSEKICHTLTAVKKRTVWACLYYPKYLHKRLLEYQRSQQLPELQSDEGLVPRMTSSHPLQKYADDFTFFSDLLSLYVVQATQERVFFRNFAWWGQRLLRLIGLNGSVTTTCSQFLSAMISIVLRGYSRRASEMSETSWRDLRRRMNSIS